MQTRERAHCARSVFPFMIKKKKKKKTPETREEVPGSSRDSSKASPDKTKEGEKCTHSDCPTDAEKHLASMPWNPELETHTREALQLLS